MNKNTKVSLVATLCTPNHQLHVLLYSRFITSEGIIKHIFGFGTKFSDKIVYETKFFTKNFVPPDQNFQEQNSSDRY